MRNLLTLITILLLVSCNKEEKQIYGKWIEYEHYTRSTNTANWKWLNPYEGVVTITKDSWDVIINGFGKVYTNPDGTLTLENPDSYHSYSYEYNKSSDILQLNSYVNDIWTSKQFLKRK